MALLSALLSYNDVYDNAVMPGGIDGYYGDIKNECLFDYNDRYTVLCAAEIFQSGNVATNLRVMVKLTSRLIYQTSVYWAKDAVRRIAEYMQHQSFIIENLNSSAYRTGTTGSHIIYIYRLCRIVI